MDSVEIIKNLCKERNIPISKLEKDCGFSNGYIRGLRKGKMPIERAKIVSSYLDVDVDLLIGNIDTPKIAPYYINENTASIAQDIYKSKELRLLFDAARDAQPEDIQTAYDMLLALKRKERGNID